MQTFLGIEIGGTKLQLAIVEHGGRIRLKRKLAVQLDQGAAGIRARIEAELAQLPEAREVQAAGVGFGGPVDWQTGKICRSHQVEGWSEFDLAGWLQPLVKAPVVVENDANAAALGEARHGAGLSCHTVFYVTLGSGVGGGLVTGGKIYHGATPGEAEIGHVRLDRSGMTLESRCSGWAIDARIRKLAHTQPAGVLGRLTAAKPGGEARHLLEALNQHDPAARALFQELAHDLAFGLSHAVHLFHPDVIILGGGLAGLGEPLRAEVEPVLRGFVMEAFAPTVRVALAGLGENAVPVGAAQLAEDLEHRPVRPSLAPA